VSFHTFLYLSHTHLFLSSSFLSVCLSVCLFFSLFTAFQSSNEADKRLLNEQRLQFSALVGNVAHDLKVPVQAIQLNLNNLRGNFKTLSKLYHEQSHSHPQSSHQANRANGAQSNPQSNPPLLSLDLTNHHRLFSIEEANESDAALWSARSPMSSELPVNTTAPADAQSKEIPVNTTAPEIPQSNELPVNTTAPTDAQSNELPVNTTAPADAQSSELPVNTTAPADAQSNAIIAARSDESPIHPAVDTAVSQLPLSSSGSQIRLSSSCDEPPLHVSAYVTEEEISQSAVDSLDVMCDYMIMTINKGWNNYHYH
jgi:hypothetical protein